jgi:CPA1 family monovalent cation:H+ antiporter
MGLFLIITLLVIVSAFYSYVNARFIKLPGTIGIVSIAVVVSFITIIVDHLTPGAAHHLTDLAKSIDFSGTVLNIMLGFLLFSAAFNLDTQKLKRQMMPVLILSTLGVILSTTIFGALFYWVTIFFHVHISFIYCLLFGALISPTDPVAVGAVIKGSRLPQNLETIISGESLFNDGIGLVLFITLLEITESGTDHIDFAKTGVLFAREVFGGIAFGAVSGYFAYRLMRSITDFQTIVLVSLGLVMGVSVVATYLHFSIPLSVVTAGIFAGRRSINHDSTEHSHQALEKFWQLIDEMLNSILFVMIGLQMINIPYLDNYWLTGLIAILVILAARWLSIMLPITFLRHTLKVKYSSINILTWAGLRGGISIALALSLPYTPYKHIILSGSYFIVIFSVIVQGLTLNRVIDASYKEVPAKS